MSIFNKKPTLDSSPQLDRLHKELSLQIEINRELKNENETLKASLLSQKKEIARFEEDLRLNPLSQLNVLHKELVFMNHEITSIIENQNSMVQQKLTESAKEICVDAFELFNQLKELKKVESIED